MGGTGLEFSFITFRVIGLKSVSRINTLKMIGQKFTS